MEVEVNSDANFDEVFVLTGTGTGEKVANMDFGDTALKTSELNLNGSQSPQEEQSSDLKENIRNEEDDDDKDKNKENINLLNGVSVSSGTSIQVTVDMDILPDPEESVDGESMSASVPASPRVNKKLLHAADSTEKRISVKERMQKFNDIASSETGSVAGTGASGSGTGINKDKVSNIGRFRRDHMHKNQNESGDDDTASLSSFGYGHGFANMQPRDREWIVKASQSDYHWLNKAAQENPELVKRRDINTALHWAAKHGNADIVKLLAGTFKSDINAKSNGGYTPLHLAAQFSRQDVYDILSRVYTADVNIRDHSGKKPLQYLVQQEATVSVPSEKMPAHMRLSSTSSSSTPRPHHRLSQTSSNNSAELPSVSLPTCNISVTGSSSNRNSAELSSTGAGAGAGTDGGLVSSASASASARPNPIERTGVVTLTSFVNRSPSSVSRTHSFRHMPKTKNITSTSTLASNSTPSSSQSSLNEIKPINRNHSFLSRNVDDMRKSFRQGVKKMWNGHPSKHPDRSASAHSNSSNTNN